MTPTGTPFRTVDMVSAGGMPDYWRQLEHLGTALSPVLAPVGGGAVAAHDSVVIAADSRDVCLTEKVSSKQTLEPALNVLSSSIITGEDSGKHNRLAYHSVDGVQSVSIMERRKAASQGEGADTGARKGILLDARGSHASGVPDDSSLWGSSMFRSKKSGLHPFNSEDPSCAILNSAVDERPVATTL